MDPSVKLSTTVKQSHNNSYAGRFVPRSFNQMETEGKVLELTVGASSITYIFTMETVGKICMYNGVLDIDFDWEDGENIEAYNSGVLPADKLEVIEELQAAILPRPYWIMWSGNKGMHIYILDDAFLFRYRKCNQTEVISSWINTFPTLTANTQQYLDAVPYANRNGIRNPFCPHPKTKLIPKLYASNTTEPVSSFFYGLESRIRNCTPYARLPVIAGPAQQVMETVELDIETYEEMIRTYILQACDMTMGRATISANKLTFPDDRYCPLLKRDHTHAKSCWFISEGRVNYHCLSGKCNNKTIVLRKKQNNKITAVPQVIRDKFQSITTTGKDKYITPQEIGRVIEAGSHSLILSAMGTGKTTALKTYLTARLEAEPNLVIVFLTTRIVQSTYFANYFSSLGFSSYTEFPGGPITHKRMVVTVNSLNRLYSEAGPRISADLLICDEIDSIVKSIYSNSFTGQSRKYSTIVDTFTSYFLLSGKVVMMDGIPTHVLYHFLNEMICTARTNVLENNRCVDERKYVIYKGLQFFCNVLRKMVKRDPPLNIALISNSKKRLQLLKDVLKRACGDDWKEEECIMICSDCTPYAKKSLANPNESWSKARFLLYNSAVGPGVSYDTPDHFSSVFVDLAPYGGSHPVDIIQNIARIRHLRSNNVYVYIAGLHDVPEESRMTPSECLIESNKRFIEFHERQNNYTRSALYDGETSYPIGYILSGDQLDVFRKLASEKRLSIRRDNSVVKRLQTLVLCSVGNSREPANYMALLRKYITGNGGVFIVAENSNENVQVSNIITSQVLLSNLAEQMKGMPTTLIPEGMSDAATRTEVVRYIDISNEVAQNIWTSLFLTVINDEKTYWDNFHAIDKGQTAFIHYLDFHPLVVKLQKYAADNGSVFTPFLTFEPPVFYNSTDQLTPMKNICRELNTLLQRVGIKSAVRCPQASASTRKLIAYIRTTFLSLGLKVTRSNLPACIVDGKKVRRSGLTFDITANHCRMALAGYDQNLQKVGKGKALELLKL